MKVGVKIAALGIALICAALLQAKPKPTAPCKVYFLTVENDEITVHLAMDGLNKPQMNWYKKHGDRKKFAGICYATDTTHVKDGAPVYAIMWGEHLASRPYSFSYTTQQQVTSSTSGTVTDEDGNTSTEVLPIVWTENRGS